MTVSRREALKRTAMIMGGALSASTIAAILDGCTAQPELNWTPELFNEEQAMLVMEMTEDIIPQTATAGAKSLGIPKFVEDMVRTRFKPEERSSFISSLENFRQFCLDTHGDKYVELDPQTRIVVLMEKNKEIKSSARYAPHEKTFFWQVKELTLLGYFTSLVGATQVLQYKAIPAQYQGCIPLVEVGGKAWATS